MENQYVINSKSRQARRMKCGPKTLVSLLVFPLFLLSEAVDTLKLTDLCCTVRVITAQFVLSESRGAQRGHGGFQ